MPPSVVFDTRRNVFKQRVMKWLTVGRYRTMWLENASAGMEEFSPEDSSRVLLALRESQTLTTQHVLAPPYHFRFCCKCLPCVCPDCFSFSSWTVCS